MLSLFQLFLGIAEGCYVFGEEKGWKWLGNPVGDTTFFLHATLLQRPLWISITMFFKDWSPDYPLFIDPCINSHSNKH